MDIKIRREQDDKEDKQLYTLNYLSRKTGLPKEIKVYATNREKAWAKLDKTEVVKRLKQPRKNINDRWE